MFGTNAVITSLLIATTGCGTASSQSEHHAGPETLAGRGLQRVTDNYLLYGSAEAAADLASWIDEQLKHAGVAQGRGIVLAIEPGVEPWPQLEEWRLANVSRTGAGLPRVWSSPIRSQTKFLIAGRPYCLQDSPYFTESFSMPVHQARVLGLLEGLNWQPAWICFLTTDETIRQSFDATLQRFREAQAIASQDVQSSFAPSDLPAILVVAAFAEFYLMPTWRLLDAELMHLQRREVFVGALLEYRLRGSERDLRLQRLRQETDAAWKHIWFRRPFD
jgi:hypothetical protein